MTEGPDEKERPDDSGPPGELEARLASIFGGEDEDGSEETTPEPEGGPRLRLDKTGALADRPKLQPRKPYARPGAPGPEPAVPALGGPGAPGAAPRKASLPPPIGRIPPLGGEAPQDAPPDDEIEIPAGSFLYGEDKTPRDLPAFRIDRRPVTNGDFAAFVRATGHRPPLYWPDGRVPGELARHPVVGVDYFDALAYARWRGKDLPYEDEWERAARGTDGRAYPWGNDPEPTQANTARLGFKMTVPVGWHEMNVSPDGMTDAVGNAWEITHSPAPGGGIVVRGGSWFDFALYAKVWFRFASRPEARNGTIGFRCVRRAKPRPAEPREVPPRDADAAIAERRGPQPTVDPGTFSAEQRDLVPDLRRLRQMTQEREAETLSRREQVLIGRTGGGSRPTLAPVKATPPPPIARARPAPASPPKPEPATAAAEEATPARPFAPEGATRAAPAAAERPASSPVPPKPRAPTPAPEVSPAREKEPALDRASLRHAADMATKGAVGSAEPAPERPETAMPLGYWIAVGCGIALVVTLLVLLVTGMVDSSSNATPWLARGGGTAAGEKPPHFVAPPPAPTPPPDETGGLPAPPASDPRDADPPRWIDAARPDDVETVEEGVWLLVFAHVPSPDGSRTVRTVDQVHRRLRDTAAHVAVVLPRGYFVNEGEGRLVTERIRTQRLFSLGAHTDLEVVLDPPDGTSFDGVLRSRYAVQRPESAILLVDGRIEARTDLAEGGFTLPALSRLAARAAEIRSRNAR